LLGTGSAATAGLVAAGSPASAVEGPPRKSDIELNETETGFVTVDTSVETSPDDAVPIGGQEQKGYVEASSGIYLQGDRTTYEPTDEPDLLVVVDGKSLVPLRAGERQPLVEGRGGITTGQTSFIGSYGREIRVSTDGNRVSLYIGDDRVVRAKPDQTQSIERDMEITYSNDTGEQSSIETTVTCTLDHMGERRIISHPSSPVVPADHRLGRYAKRALGVQQGDSRIPRERVQHDGRNYVMTANGFVRIVPVLGADSFIIKKISENEITGGGQ